VAHVWTAGRLALDFANAASPGSYADLAQWAGEAGVVTPAEARALARAAARRRPAAAAALMQATALQASIASVMLAVAERRPPPTRALAELNDALAIAVARRRLVRRGAGFVWEWNAGRDQLDRLLWPVIRSAADVLTSRDVAAVRACAASGCRRLFLDGSRNGTRRWCEMAVCGNRAKVRRHYTRRRSRSARSAGGKSSSANRRGSTHSIAWPSRGSIAPSSRRQS